ncbi:hypothetical protein TWF481_011323 [Arthrobotrys musiformis]|uniref:F-box domain-containing protein n=1 Tax=Arthrobotrys musiformis TaxID=47236 RepID=A0AAV9VY76_9PEZI
MPPPHANAHLPAELLIQIFSNLSTEDHFSAAATCTFWRTIILQTPSLLASRYTLFKDTYLEHGAIHNIFLPEKGTGKLSFSVKNSKIQEFYIATEIDGGVKPGAKVEINNPPRKRTAIPNSCAVLDEHCFATDDMLNTLLSDTPLERPAFLGFGWGIPSSQFDLSHRIGTENFHILIPGCRLLGYSLAWTKVRYRSVPGYANTGTSLRQLAEEIVRKIEGPFREFGVGAAFFDSVYFVELRLEGGFDGNRSFKAVVYHPEPTTISEEYRRFVSSIDMRNTADALARTGLQDKAGGPNSTKGEIDIL